MTSSDFAQVAAITEQLKSSYKNEESPWIGSRFEWIKNSSSRRIGAIGENIVRAWAKSEGFSVAKPVSSDHDAIIAGLKLEIKFSTLWAGGSFKFQQIRDQDYTHCFCLGIEPADVKAWFFPKTVLMVDRPPHLGPQHGGQRGTETRALQFPSAMPPDWLTQYGGTLSRVSELMREAEQGE